ncbi:MAG: hypothetical protein IPJ27_08760 [Candidatus Accumulibacter sp.]|uniref:Uncharacterized protein n=1 Tax=Candidatus Accumulibacter proximus TaxID=2954385 RepID=A0A935PYS6_9PROT|nr:hypothetical protein [Candidatus Accumulibacter proximus]
MNLFNRLPGFVETPPGERTILRLLPRLLLLGTLLMAVPPLLARLVFWDATAEVAASITLWTSMRSVSSSCTGRWYSRGDRCLHRDGDERAAYVADAMHSTMRTPGSASVANEVGVGVPPRCARQS